MTNCHDLKITSHLIKAVLDSFVPIHAPSSTTVYIARDNNSVLHQDQNVLSDLGLEVKHLIGNTVLDSFVPIHAPSSTTVYIARDNNSVLHQDQNVLSDLGLEVKHLIGNTDLVLKLNDPKEPQSISQEITTPCSTKIRMYFQILALR